MNSGIDPRFKIYSLFAAMRSGEFKSLTERKMLIAINENMIDRKKKDVIT
jgi:hypothetical protein